MIIMVMPCFLIRVNVWLSILPNDSFIFTQQLPDMTSNFWQNWRVHPTRVQVEWVEVGPVQMRRSAPPSSLECHCSTSRTTTTRTPSLPSSRTVSPSLIIPMVTWPLLPIWVFLGYWGLQEWYSTVLFDSKGSYLEKNFNISDTNWKFPSACLYLTKDLFSMYIFIYLLHLFHPTLYYFHSSLSFSTPAKSCFVPQNYCSWHLSSLCISHLVLL